MWDGVNIVGFSSSFISFIELNSKVVDKFSRGECILSVDLFC